MIFSFYNDWHLGDCVLHLYYLRALEDYGYEHTYDFYVRPEYISELQTQITGYKNIRILPRQYAPSNSINSWINVNNYFFNDILSWDYNNFYIRWFGYLSEKIGLINPVKSMVCKYKEIINNIPKDSWDILYINSEGFSNGYIYNKMQYDELANLLEKKFKILTTHKIDGFECTRDYNWNLLQIAGASINCKYVIGNNTSPIHLCFNKWTLPNIKKWFVLDARNTFTFNNNIEIIQEYSQWNKILKYFEGEQS